MSEPEDILGPDESGEHPLPEAPAPGAPRAELGALIEQYLQLRAVPEDKRDDDYAGAERDCRERINSEFWQRLFGRLAEVAAASAGDELAFGEGDDRLFDFGWIDERLFPAGQLAYDAGFSDPAYEVRDLRAHLAGADAAFLLAPERGRLAAELAKLREHIEELVRATASCAAARAAAEAALPAIECAQLAEFNRFLDGATAALATLESHKRSKGLAGEKMRDYAKLRTAFDDAQARRDSLLHRAGTRGKAVAEQNRNIHKLKTAAVECLQKLEKLNIALANLETEAAARRPRRRAELEARLAEIREDITLCGRWGRTTASPGLLQDRQLNSKTEVVEAIRRVEDFDPDLFANRRVLREGRPVVVLTPGIGNGSYDFRSNILILPRTSPRSRLESVAFALALYRRDLDTSSNEGQLWKSFLGDIPWAKLGGTPRSVQAQIRAFVRAYTAWATREAVGQPVLPPDIRAWFEQKIAPSILGPIMPRELRGIPASRRDALLAELQPRTDQGRAGAEEMLRQGGLYWLKEDWSRALAAFDRSRELDPAFAPAWWALAACYRLPPETFHLDIGLPERLKRAREALQSFISAAEQSWWTRQAQSLMAELDAKLEEMRRAGGG